MKRTLLRTPARGLAALLALGGLLLLAPPPAAADAGDSRTFKAHNFRLTLPSKDWEFLEVTAQETSDGYVARTVRRVGKDAGTYVEAYAYVAPTNGLSLLERMHEMLQAAAGDFESTDVKNIGEARLSGLPARVAHVAGRAKSGGTGFYLWFGVAAGDKFHHLLVKAYNGSERETAAEIDALRRGYRLLEGAGPEEEAPAEPPSYGGEGGGGTSDADSWPAKGPQREGRTLVFPSWSLRWTLPEGSPFQVTAVVNDEKAHKQGLMLRLEGKLPGIASAKREGEPEKPPVDPQCEVQFITGPAPAGVLPKDVMNNDGVLANIAKQVFDRVEVGRRQVVPDAPIGNLTGAAMQLTGQKGDLLRFFRLYTVFLHGKEYSWVFLLDGDKNADDVFKGPIKDLLAAVEFTGDLAEPVRGPLAIEGVPHDVAERGKTGEGKEIPYNGFKFKRPKELRQLEVPAGGGAPGFQLALEARTEDGQAYFYADVSVRNARELQQGNVTLEDLAGQRKTAWETEAKDAVTVTKGKQAWYGDNFGPGKGVAYRFLGAMGEVPFVERGWIVKVKDRVFLIREQFGGADAEKTLEKLAKAFEKALKIDAK